MTVPVLEINGLSVAFTSIEGTTQAVRNCTLAVGAGEVLGLVGESGSGKSLSAMACLGLLPDEARIAGSIKLKGQEIVGLTASKMEALRGRGAAMIFQNPATALNPYFTAGRQLCDVISVNRGARPSEARNLALESLEAVHIPDPASAMEKYPHQMSGGQLQRVMIAMALACDPALLIADEPTTALDVTIQAQIVLLLRELARRRNLAILFISHDLGVVASLCDWVAVMYAGEVVETGRTSEVLSQPLHPYSRMLLATVPQVKQATETLRHIPGQVPDMMRPPAGCAFHPRCDMTSEQCGLEVPAKRFVGETRSVRCHHALAGAAHHAACYKSDQIVGEGGMK